MIPEKRGKRTWSAPRRAVLSGKRETLGGLNPGACESAAFVVPYGTRCLIVYTYPNFGPNPGFGYTGILTGPCSTGPTVFGCAAATPGS